MSRITSMLIIKVTICRSHGFARGADQDTSPPYFIRLNFCSQASACRHIGMEALITVPIPGSERIRNSPLQISTRSRML